jgi:spiro-SPASM protein
VQAVRLKESEDQLEDFYRHWKEKTEHVIIQKYDHFCGYLPERKVTDLSPLKRFPCWHIKRDLVVRLDGSVTVCREDLDRSHVLGNAFEEDLSEIWDRGDTWYLRHLDEDYPELCKNCDEYYTYNF